MSAQETYLNNLFSLLGKNALVTGGSKGLGYSVAKALSNAGAQVALCSRNQQEAAGAASSIQAETGNVVQGFITDVRSKEQVNDLVSSIETQWGSIDVLIVCAGVNIRNPAIELLEEDWDTVIDINLKGSFLAAQAVLPRMYTQKWGRIVFFSSMLATISIPGRAPYTSSKAAINGLTTTLALESAPYNVCVNSISPGPFRTPMNVAIEKDPVKYKEFLNKIPIGRWGEPDEIEGLALYLSSPACSFMTGSNLVIDGGYTSQ